MSLRRQRITANKRLRFTSPKLPSVTSFIRKTLYEMPKPTVKGFKIRNVIKYEG